VQLKQFVAHENQTHENFQGITSGIKSQAKEEAL
jgi:hypothetical protein